MKMHSTSRQRKEHMNANKENAQQLNSKMQGVAIVLRKATSPSAKLRKNSDSTDDRLPRMKGLQVTAANVVNNVNNRRRIQSSSDAAGASKPAFAKTRFAVYNDEKPKSTNQSTDRYNSLKAREIEKWVQSGTWCKVSVALPAAEKKPADDKKLSGQSSERKKSPKNLPAITKPAVFNIKEKHHQKSLQRKSPKAAYELLSLELAYNIDYMTEYIRHQVEMNERKKLSSSFLKRGITADQRRLIVKYLISSTTYYKCPSFVLYQAVKIFDAYIDKVNVSLHELQTIALAALWIAQKKDLIIDEIPEAAKIMKLVTSKAGDQKSLLESEKKILMSLQFEVNFADPFSMLALFAIMVEEVRELEASKIQELYYCGSYLMDLSLMDKDLCDVLAIHLAEVCIEIALVVSMTNSDNPKNDEWNHWPARMRQSNRILEEYVLSNKEMTYIRNQLLQKAVLSKDKTRDYYAVYKKYCTKRYGAISVFLTSKISSFYIARIVDGHNSNNVRPIVF